MGFSVCVVVVDFRKLPLDEILTMFFFVKLQSSLTVQSKSVELGGDRGYPAIRFEYKTASERYLVAEL